MAYTVLTPTVYDASLSAAMGKLTQGRDVTEYSTGEAPTSWTQQAAVAVAIAQAVDTRFGAITALTASQQNTLSQLVRSAVSPLATDTAVPPNSYAAIANAIQAGYAATPTV